MTGLLGGMQKKVADHCRQSLQWTDRRGQLLASKVQVTRTLTLLSDPSGLVGLIESLLSEDKGVTVTATLDRSRAKCEVTMHCMNLGTEPQVLIARLSLESTSQYRKARERRLISGLRVCCQEPVQSMWHNA